MYDLKVEIMYHWLHRIWLVENQGDELLIICHCRVCIWSLVSFIIIGTSLSWLKVETGLLSTVGQFCPLVRSDINQFLMSNLPIGVNKPHCSSVEIIKTCKELDHNSFPYVVWSNLPFFFVVSYSLSKSALLYMITFADSYWFIHLLISTIGHWSLSDNLIVQISHWWRQANAS